METIDEHLVQELSALQTRLDEPPLDNQEARHLVRLFKAQTESRHLDFAARWLQSRSMGFYTIGSAGHESNAVLGMLSRPDDPALLHYRSGGFYAGRAHAAGHHGSIRDVLLGLTCAQNDPISGGRHKVYGHPELSVIPQTSTIGSHPPRAVGLALSLDLAERAGQSTPWSRDAIVLCSFGDASANHSTTQGALNSAAYLTHTGVPCPVLFVCEDNGIGISTPTPHGWPARMLRSLPFDTHWQADGDDPRGLLRVVAEALATVRETRRPTILHLRTVRFMGHAGSDVEIAYRSRTQIQADYDRDPLLATARALVGGGHSSPDELLSTYESTRARVMEEAERVCFEKRLADRDSVIAPLALPSRPPSGIPLTVDNDPGPAYGRASGPTLAQAINTTLGDLMNSYSEALLFGEDVGIKGGVYGVTRGLRKRFGGTRVFDTLLDEQTILGIALGSALAGYVPIPEIQYLAYLHNAEDQLRGEAASLRFFSNGQYQNGMVVRIAGLAYQLGFGGHFHNDNSVAVLRDIPGLVLAVPSVPAAGAGLLRECFRLARDEGRVCVFLEPIARYHTRDLHEPGDGLWSAPPVSGTGTTPLGQVGVFGTGRDALIVTFGNGVYLSRRAASTLHDQGVDITIVDLQWLSPLPQEALTALARGFDRILVVDETRRSGGVAESVLSLLVEARPDAHLARVSSADSFIPLGPAADTVLLSEEDIVRATRRLVMSSDSPSPFE